jgi:hypothetical protein
MGEGSAVHLPLQGAPPIPGPTPHRWRRSLAAALFGSALLAGPADAELVNVGANHNVSVFHNLDFVAAFGGTPGTTTTVEVLRNGHRIGTATGPSVFVGEFPAPNDGGLEVNHGPVGAPQPGDCFEGFTPDIIPGDHIVVTRGAETEEVIVDDITIAEGPIELPDGDIVVRGRAALADGTPIPVAALDSGEVREGSTFRANPNEVLRTPGTTDGWTAIYRAPFLAFKGGGLPLGSQRAGVLIGDHAMGHGHIVPLPLETQLFDGADTPGPALGCEASASQSNAVASLDDRTVNTTSDTLDVSGTAMAATLDEDITGATVKASDGTKTVTAAATGAFGGAGQTAWTAQFTRAQLDSLADGVLKISADYAAGGGTLGGKSLTITKDTVAPSVVADLAPGEYLGPVSVALSAAAGETIAYRTDGLAHSATDTAYSGPIALPFGATTLAVRATDAAGNVTDTTLAYQVNRPAGPAQAPAPAVVAPVQAIAPRTTVLTLRAVKRARLRSVRRSGLAVSFVAPSRTRVAVARLYRLSGARRTVVARRSLEVRANRRHTVRFGGRSLRPGLYLIEVRVGASTATLGPATTRRVRIAR